MAHVRTQLRDLVKAALDVSLIAGGRVHIARTYPVEEAELPAVLIYTNNELVEPGTGRKWIRTVELIIHVIDKGDTIDQKIDDLSITVEETITKTIFNGLIRQVDFTGTDKTFQDGGNYQIGHAILKFDVVYITNENNPETAE